MSWRIDKVKQRVKEVEVFLVKRLPNIYYLTGFTGSNGLLLLSEKGVIFFTDRRYKEQAKMEISSDIEIEVVEGDLLEKMSLHPLVKGSKKIGFESNGVSYDEYLTLRKKMKGKKLLPIHRAIEIVRMIKEEKEITYLKKALKLSLKGLNEVKKMIVEGVTERDIALELEYQLKKLSSSYLSFPPIVASGPNSSLPHAKPTKRKITATDVVVLDFGVRYNFYAADITRTILIGGNRKAHKIYSIVKEAHRKAIETVKVGIPFKKVDESARKVIEEEGLGEFFIHSTGHGIGLEVHEEPRVSKKNETKIEEGMVFTIEPGIYLPGWGGVRIEDVIVVREDGVEVISR